MQQKEKLKNVSALMNSNSKEKQFIDVSQFLPPDLSKGLCLTVCCYRRLESLAGVV